MDKEDVVHMYNGILLSIKGMKLCLAEIWVDLQTVIQSEEIQKEKSKYFILTHICEI